MSRSDVVVVTGEALVDLVAGPDGTLRAHPGGGPYNVARTLGRLERPVRYLGRISTDAFGERLRAELAADGVDPGALVPTDALTTLALAELDAAGGARYRFYDAGTSAPGLTLAEATAALPERIGAFYAGTLGLVFEPIASTVEALVDRMPEDAVVAVDPNCRPATIRDPAAYRARLARVLRRADVVKVSEDDLAWLAPGRVPEAAARDLLAEGAVALVTLGGDGALVVTADAVAAVAAPPVDVVDTIGAGDAFMGAFLAEWGRRGHGREALTHRAEVIAAAEFACRVAAVTCSRAGADPPRRAEL